MSVLSTTSCLFCCFRAVRCHKSLTNQPPTMKIFSLHNAHRHAVYTRNDNQAPKGNRWRHSRTNYHSLMGEVKGPAPPTVLAMTRSAICLRARRPVGLLPFVNWSWMRPSSSSLNTCENKREYFFPSRVEERGHKQSVRASITRATHTHTQPELTPTPPRDVSGSTVDPSYYKSQITKDNENTSLYMCGGGDGWGVSH